MSEHAAEPTEQRSSLKVMRNAKGEAQWEIKVIAGEQETVLDQAREIALHQYRQLERDLS